MNNTNLHVYLSTWNVSGFKKYLETGEITGLEAGGGGSRGNTPNNGFDGLHERSAGKHNGNNSAGRSSSGPKSWSLQSFSHLPKRPDPNVKDSSGRTVLHLACSSLDPRSYDFLSVLLAHPHVQINITDVESGWTALHRAMWAGNLRAARELLGRADVDLGVKDNEGLTAMDLWNSTCEDTNPDEDAEGTDLFTWGSNKNCTLGLADPSDRALPERVKLLTVSQASESTPSTPRTPHSRDSSPGTANMGRGRHHDSSRFDQTGVRAVAMAKWHTAAVTTESRGNISLAGMGSNGRLGRTVHSQYALRPHGDLPHTILSVALGQDHTLALTSGGFILSWGQNRFAQLGYTIDLPTGGQESVHRAFNTAAGTTSPDDLVQTVPRRILGPLKKETVLGVAASRLSSACWTEDAVWTWGTNGGHLGYEKAANPVQVQPRKATAIAQPVLDLAMTDYALACLLESHEVLVLHGDASVKITFPTQRFPSEFKVSRPPAFVARPNITKITSSGITFAALSSLGDVFTFAMANPVDTDATRDARGKQLVVKPQMVWALRKRFTAVKDVALGSDGAVIICTHSGHVFVRQRVGKQWSFKRIPFLQRVIRVSANETGSFAAIRSDARPSKLVITGSTLPEDMLDLLPHMQRFSHTRRKLMETRTDRRRMDEDDEDEYDEAVLRDTVIVQGLAHAIIEWRPMTDEALVMGCDAYVLAQQRYIPCHAFLLISRLAPLRPSWKKGTTGDDAAIVIGQHDGVPVLDLSGYNTWSALLLLQYVYSDDMTAIWDSRVQHALREYTSTMQVDIARIRRELGALAQIFKLVEWERPLSLTGKVAMTPTLPGQLLRFHQDAQHDGTSSRDQCDVILRLADKDVYGHSLLLRGRCPFFEAMYGDEAWTVGRRDEDGNGHVVIDLPNIQWRSARPVLKYLHDGAEQDIFDYDHQGTLDEFLDFVFEVMAVANEFLLDRMVLLCSAVVRRHVAITNASALACEASFYHAHDLKRSIFSYIAASLETMMENGMLDQMDLRVLDELARFVQDKQGMKLPVSRSNILLEMAVERHADWLGEQDLPSPRIRAPRTWKPRSPRIYPSRSTPSKTKAVEVLKEDDIFAMDDDVPPMSPRVVGSVTPQAHLSRDPSASPWRSTARDVPQRTDLRAIMAETSKQTTERVSRTAPVSVTARSSPTPAPPPSTPSPQSTARIRTPSNAAFPTLAQAASAPKFNVSPSNIARRPSGLGQEIASSNAEAGPSHRRPPAVVPNRVFTPRKVSEPAWSVPTLASPAPAPPIMSPSTTAMSLLSIQASQALQAQQVTTANAGPRSLLEIQDQERRDEEARVAEKEFERWWKEEEARVAREAKSATVVQPSKPPKKRHRPPKPRTGEGPVGGPRGGGGGGGGRGQGGAAIPTGRNSG